MIPLTEPGLDFLFVKQQQDAAGEGGSDGGGRGSSGGKAVVKYRPALPELSCLALSGRL
jgi:hypothetical protein